MLNKNKKIIIGVIIGFVILGIIGYFLPDDPTTNNDTETNNNTLSSEKTNEFHQDDDINRFIVDYNETNPNNKFTAQEISRSLNYKTNISNHTIQSIELLYHKNAVDKKHYISIQLENYGDTTSLKQIYKEMMKTINDNLTDDTLDEIWNNIINNNYEVDYDKNGKAYKYDDIYLSFKDSGDVEVRGQKNFCFVRIYGIY